MVTQMYTNGTTLVLRIALQITVFVGLMWHMTKLLKNAFEDHLFCEKQS